MCNCLVTAIRDQFPKVKAWQAVILVAIVGFSIGLVYVTPVNKYVLRHAFFNALTKLTAIILWFVFQGGQAMLNLVDFFGASFIAYVLAIAEIAAVCWIYGKFFIRAHTFSRF